MKSLLLVTLLLTGCSTLVPVENKFPEAPPEIAKPCDNLGLVPSTKKLSEVMTVVTDNYGKYYDCSYKVEAWQEWYTKQKKIHDEANK